MSQFSGFKFLKSLYDKNLWKIFFSQNSEQIIEFLADRGGLVTQTPCCKPHVANPMICNCLNCNYILLLTYPVLVLNNNVRKFYEIK